jgi:hypothetical protein
MTGYICFEKTEVGWMDGWMDRQTYIQMHIYIGKNKEGLKGKGTNIKRNRN